MYQEGFPAFSVTTTNNAATALASIAVPPGETAIVTAYIVGKRASDGSTYASKKEVAAFADTNGDVTLVGIVSNLLEGLLGFGGLLGLNQPKAQLQAVDGTVQVTVTGANNSTINWEALVEVRRSGSPPTE